MADIAKIGFQADTSDLKRAEADLDRLPPAAGRAEVAASKLADKVKGLGSAFSTKLVAGLASAKAGLIAFVVGVAAISVAGIVSAFGALAQKLDDISKASTKLHESMQNVQALGLAADLAGLEMGALSMAAQRMNKALATAIATGKGTQGVFAAIGVSAQDLVKMPIVERMAFLADKLDGLNLSAEETALVLSKLGDRSGSLAALFAGGGDQIRDAASLLKDFNGELSSQDGQNIEAMNDAFTKLQYSIQAIGNQILAAVAPAITAVVEGLAYFVSYIGRAFGAMVSFTTGFVTGIAKCAAKLIEFVGDITGLSSLFSWLGGVFQKLFGVTIGQAVKAGANAIINTFSATFQGIAILWEDGLPAVFGAAVYGAAKIALDGLDKFISSAVNLFAGFAQQVYGMFGVAVDTSKIAASMPKVANTDFYKNIAAKFENNKNVASSSYEDASKAYAAQMAVDNFASANESSAKAANDNKAGISGLNDMLGGTADKAAKAAEKITELEGISKELGAISAPFDQAKSAYDKLAEMQTNGVLVGDQYTAMLSRIQDAFMRAGGTAEQWSKIITTKTSEMADAIKSFAETSINGLGSSIADLAVDGKADFKALADSIIKDLIKMAFQAMITKPLLSMFGFADGGAFGSSAPAPSGAQAFAKGGAFTNNVYSKPTPFMFANGGGFGLGVMGEAGNEAVMPLTRGPDGKLGVQAHGGGAKAAGGLHIDKIEMHISREDSSGMDDEAFGTMIADKFTDRVEQIALRTMQGANQYGGAANPRGMGGI